MAHSWSYGPASLALAMVAGHTYVQMVRPMLDGPGEFSIGTLTVRSLAPSGLHLGVKKRTRSEVLAYCKALNTQVSAMLNGDADAMMEHDKEMATYILEWSEQTTTTDLRDIPDDLLDRLPAFDHSKVLIKPFFFTARLDWTEAFAPPM